MEKSLKEEDIKGLEEEIELAVDRLFVPKTGPGARADSAIPPSLEPTPPVTEPEEGITELASEMEAQLRMERPSSATQGPFEKPSELLPPLSEIQESGAGMPEIEKSLGLLAKPLEEAGPGFETLPPLGLDDRRQEPVQFKPPLPPSGAIPEAETAREETVDVLAELSSEIDATFEAERPAYGAPEQGPVHLPLERMETQLLSLEWEINRENLRRTREEVLSLRMTLRDGPETQRVLDFMEQILERMIQGEENVDPRFIQFLLDAKETIKLLLRKERDADLRTYQRLAYEGMEARFSCLKGWPDLGAKSGFQNLIEEMKKIEMPSAVRKKIEEISIQFNLFSQKVEETLKRVDQKLANLTQRIPSPSERIPKPGLVPMSVIVCKVDGKLLGVPSEKVLKLYRVPETFYHRYGDQQTVRMKELEVKVVDLKRVLAIEGEPLGERRILVVRDGGAYKGLIISQVLQKVSALSAMGMEYGEYFIGVMPWSWETHSFEVPILDLEKV